jgi:hypothetical protein
MNLTATALSVLFLLSVFAAFGCSRGQRPTVETVASPKNDPTPVAEPAPSEATPPPAIAAWMDRLTVPHFYDPATGFIVAREPTLLPPILADAPPLDRAIAEAGEQRLVVVFVTADRCAPCQQYKLDALNDATVITRLSESRFLPTHLEVDRAPELADAHLGSRGIPMTYALRDGTIVATLRGQRSAGELLAWIDALPE